MARWIQVEKGGRGKDVLEASMCVWILVFVLYIEEASDSGRGILGG